MNLHTAWDGTGGNLKALKKEMKGNKEIKYFSFSPTFDFQEHAAQRCQSRKPKGCGNEAALTASETAC